MKSLLVSVAALVAAVFTIAAHAQTGRPSDEQLGAQSPVTRAAPLSTNEDEVGSYARWLMLQGKTREEAVAQARTFDHPAPVRKFALQHGAGAASTQQ